MPSSPSLLDVSPSPSGTSARPAPAPWPGPEATLDDLLAFAGKKYALEFEPVSAGGVTLRILQIANMRELLDAAIAENALKDALTTLPLWAKIWPASLVLGHALASLPPAGHKLLEIGAGCGVAGLVAAALGFNACITDINPDALLFARINILANDLGERARVCRADIESDNLGERFSLVLGAEILYLEHLYRPLVKFLARHLRAGGSDPAPAALLATDHRRNAKRFFKLAEKEFSIAHKPIGIRARPAPEDGPADAGREERHLLSLHRLTPLGAVSK